MNIQEYLKNPNGKGSSAFMVSDMRKVLDEQYKALHGTLSVRWHKISERHLIAHVKVPSHSVERLYYDVLLEFDIDTIPKNQTVINNGNCRVFSNCPSFVYTYAHVFDENKNLISWCKKKYPKQIFTKDPKTRNPSKIINYERSLYFAIKFILSEGRNYKGKINLVQIKEKTHSNLLDKIQSVDEVLEIYNRNKKKKSANEKKEDKKQKTSKPITKKEKKGVIKTVITTKKTKQTNRVKKTKKI